MADESKNDVKNGSNTSSSNPTEAKNSAVAKNTAGTSAVTPKQVENANKPPETANKGGDETMAKDPTGMFDYSNCKTYVVKEGDQLLDIAQKFGIALQQLRYFNHLNKTTFKIKNGQTIYIPKQPILVPAGK